MEYCGESLYFCKICKKLFFCKLDFVRYEVVYFILKLYICRICGKFFKCFNVLNDYMSLYSYEERFLFLKFVDSLVDKLEFDVNVVVKSFIELNS